MDFAEHIASGFNTDYLLTQYQNLAKVTKETHANGQTRYRFKPIDNTPGVWISKNDARNRLEVECAKHMTRLSQCGARRYISNDIGTSSPQHTEYLLMARK